MHSNVLTLLVISFHWNNVLDINLYMLKFLQNISFDLILLNVVVEIHANTADCASLLVKDFDRNLGIRQLLELPICKVYNSIR
jgi:hypothetical protein